MESTLDGTAMLCFHGSPRSVDERILAETPGAELESLFAGHAADVCAGGHTHLQLLRRVGPRLYVNPGSIGVALAGAAPAPGVAEYAIVEADGSGTAVELRRVGFDAGAVERAVDASGMPDPREWAVTLARRISRRNSAGGWPRSQHPANSPSRSVV